MGLIWAQVNPHFAPSLGTCAGSDGQACGRAETRANLNGVDYTNERYEGISFKKRERIATLLDHALQRLTVKRRSSDQLIDLPSYRRLLKSSWDSYTPDAFFFADIYELSIADPRLRQDVLDIIRTELSEFIHDDRVMSVVFWVHGGPGNGFRLEEVLTQLLKVAVVRGVQFAANAFHDCLEQRGASFQVMGLLNGVRVEKELEVSPGIRLFPLSRSTSELPSFLAQSHSFLRDTHLLGRTLILIDMSISPTFANPGSLISIDDYDSLFQPEIVCSSYPDFSIEEFCDALSLALAMPVRLSAQWRHIEPDKIYNFSGVFGGATYRTHLLHEHSTAVASESDVANALSLYEARRNLEPGVARKLKVPIDRWIKSNSNADIVDTFIDLGIALESLYLEDIRDDGEFRFRLSLRGAWYLEEEVDKRQTLVAEFRKLYDLRSKAVHLGEVGPGGTRNFAKRGQDLCLQSITKVLRDGSFPRDWNRLVLGCE